MTESQICCKLMLRFKVQVMVQELAPRVLKGSELRA